MSDTSPTNLMATLRALVPQRQLSWYEAVRVSELQANRFRELLGIDTPELPSEAITELPRIFVTCRHDLPVSGLAHWDNGRWVIALNAYEPEVRQRFSLAHEFKHVIDHTTRQWLAPDTGGDTSASKTERLADYFAGCLLMPKRHLKRLAGQRLSIEQLADTFGVSVRAVQVRLSQLGMTDPQPRCARPTVMWLRSNGRRYSSTPRSEGVAA
jgi:Zn-dependent peptidase ImmA (M78 family)